MLRSVKLTIHRYQEFLQITSSLLPLVGSKVPRSSISADHIHLAFVVYDWLINLDEEIRCFANVPKGRKLNAAVLLYGLSRYPPMLQVIFVFRTIYHMGDVVGV